MTNGSPLAAQDQIAEVDGWPINVATEADAIAKILDAAERGESFAAFTLNLDHLVKLRADAAFRDAYRAARFVTADGAPVAKLASQSGRRVLRTTGADLVIPLAAGAAQRKLGIALYGSTPDVLARAGRSLSEASGGNLHITRAVSPPYGFDPEGAVADAALDDIAASGARLCFVALGAPKQEILAARAVKKGVPVGFVCIGAALDFLAGAQQRAPAFMRNNGLEWFWRVATNPRRLGWRYVQCGQVLSSIVVRRSLAKLRGQEGVS